MMFLFLLQLCNLTLSVADLKNAFCQSDSLDRSAGPLFVEPCEGLDLPPGSLIQLIAPVYGLNDAPLRWHRTLTAWLIKQGYRKSLLEPCLYVHYAPGGSVDGLILIEVDDLAIGTNRTQEARVSAKVLNSVPFTKVGENERPASLADGSGSEIRMSWSIKKNTFWKSFTLHSCAKNSRKTGGSHWMNSNNSVHLCIRSVGLPRRVVPRLQDPRRFWHNT